AAGMQDMGKVMGKLKPQMQGRADMGKVSGLVKQKLAG
ncbi:MAG: GatB/YqeY domain-containing protein, partial [Candidatus Thiodiazotropha taylori]|nr:GatB/YqeY domain-containing protein [Candidatus Thiodiazotropha taylori]